jgi:hypothetical protein
VAPGNNGAGGCKPVWQYNGNPEKPTFSPSLMVRSGHYAGGHKSGDDCYCTWEARYGSPPPHPCTICHSVVTDGRIAFCSDSTHALAGQTVDLPDFPD